LLVVLFDARRDSWRSSGINRADALSPCQGWLFSKTVLAFFSTFFWPDCR
jgi:hypothetical protein